MPVWRKMKSRNDCKSIPCIILIVTQKKCLTSENLAEAMTRMKMKATYATDFFWFHQTLVCLFVIFVAHRNISLIFPEIDAWTRKKKSNLWPIILLFHLKRVIELYAFYSCRYKNVTFFRRNEIKESIVIHWIESKFQSDGKFVRNKKIPKT